MLQDNSTEKSTVQNRQAARNGYTALQGAAPVTAAALRDELLGYTALETFAPQLLLHAMQTMGLLTQPGQIYSTATLADDLQIVPKYHHLTMAIIAILAANEYITVDGTPDSAPNNAPANVTGTVQIRSTPKVGTPATRQQLKTLAARRDELQQAHPMLAPHFHFLWTCCHALPTILRGKVLATDIIFPGGSMELVAPVYRGLSSDYFSQLTMLGVKNYVAQTLANLDPSEKLRIIEIGAGTGSATGFILEALAPFAERLTYLYTDISQVFLRHGRQRFAARYPFIMFDLLNIEEPVTEQGFASQTADVVIGVNVVHTTHNVQTTLQNLKQLLKPEGLFVLNEATQFSAFSTLTFGLLDGWWAFEDGDRRLPHTPLLSQPQWQTALTSEGFYRTHTLTLPQSLGDYGSVHGVLLAQSDGVITKPYNRATAVNHATAVNENQPAGDPVREQNITMPRPTIEQEPTGRVSVESMPPKPTVVQIERIILGVVSDLLKLPVERIDLDRSFAQYGVDSIVGIELVNKINEAVGVALQTTVLFDYPDIPTLAQHITRTHTVHLPQASAPVVDAPCAPLQADGMPLDISVALTASGADPERAPIPVEPDVQQSAWPEIAIIGMAGRFPMANDLDELWQNLAQGRSAIREIPRERWSIADYYDPDRTKANKTVSKWAGYLDDIDHFDAKFFKLSGREAEMMDPQQRLFLEMSWAAIEDAGYTRETMDGQQWGVFLGGGGGDYQLNMMRAGVALDGHACIGNDPSICAARIAYHLNLKGPTFAVNTACSSSLVAIHLACQSLHQGESTVALAGGVCINTTPDFHILTSKVGMLSPTGRCQTFDAAADGIVLGEGVGVVVLKPLHQALADGDPIHGVIKSSGMNQDGRTNGITAPSALSQSELEKQVYAQASIQPETISYIECHGTGTNLGDPIEIEALTNAFRVQTEKTQFCAIGSIKTNIGHAATAAGIASLIKVLLAMKHQQLPPSLNYSTPNPRINFGDSPFYVNTALEPWHVEQGPRRAAVSSFGFSGTNVHLVIDEFVPQLYGEQMPAAPSRSMQPQLLVLSAQDETQLRVYARKLRNFVAGQAKIDLAAVAYTLQIGREAMPVRLAFVCTAQPQVCATLDAFVQGSSADMAIYTGRVVPRHQQPTNFIEDDEFASMIDGWMRTGNLNKVADLWVSGYAVDWHQLHPSERPRRLALPTYPFAGERYWFPQPKTELAATSPAATSPANEATRLLPVLPHQSAATNGTDGAILCAVPEWHEHPLPVRAPALLPWAQTTIVVADSRPDLVEAIRRFAVGADVLTLPPHSDDVADTIEQSTEFLLGLLQEQIQRAGDITTLLLLVPDTFVYRPLAGLLKTARLEHPKLQAKIVYIARWQTHSASAIQTVLTEERRADSFAQADVRYDETDRRLLLQLVESTPATATTSRLRHDGVYWITGGLGGLGQLLAQHLVARLPAVRILLTGRSPIDAARQQQVAALNTQGTKVVYLQADVSRRADVDRVVAHIKQEYGALHGIFHSAGLIHDRYLLDKRPADVASVLAPKVAGTLHLDAATREESLDFMLFFSSITGLRGNAGQADYAVANAFLDSFATHRQAMVMRGERAGETVAVNWPLWAEGGMHVDAATLALMAREGIVPLATADGLRIIEQILSTKAIAESIASQLMVVAGDLTILRSRLLGGPQSYAVTATTTEAASEARRFAARQELLDNAHITERLRADLRSSAATILKIKRDDVTLHDELKEFGFESITLTEFTNALNQQYDLHLTPTIFFEYNTLNTLATHLLETETERLVSYYAPVRKQTAKTDLPDLLQTSSPVTARPVVKERPQAPPVAPSQGKDTADEAIAIVGMSGIMPQSADLATFWRHLAAGESMISEVPAERWDWRAYDDDPDQAQSWLRWGGFIPDVDKFDPLFFKISPSEAEMMDPQHRLFLQCAWHCIEDAGYRASDLSGRPIGVYAGVQFQEYQALIVHETGAANTLMGTGTAHAMLANRVSYLLNLHGPSEAIDTACSSALVALHRAVQSIRSGEIEAALVGGVSLSLSPVTHVVTGKMGILAPDGKCRTFDQDAAGYVKGEGVGVVLLKPLRQAQADGDHIYALIRGSAENHGGHAASLTAPNPSAQATLLQSAYRNAAIDPATVSYIETHGTGTPLGDPIEIDGLKRAFRAMVPKISTEPTCGLGSVKPSTGHLEPAAGIASLLKVLLAMQHELLPATINFTTQNPYIDLTDSPFYLVTKTQPWPRLTDAQGQPLPRRAGISSFGFGGTNAHVVLEAYDEAYEAPDNRPKQQPRLDQSAATATQLIVLSARDEEQLHLVAQRLLDFLTARETKESVPALPGQEPVQQYLVKQVAALLGVAFEEIDPAMRFADYGLDPVALSQLRVLIGEGRQDSTTLPAISPNTTIAGLAAELDQVDGQIVSSSDDLKNNLPVLRDLAFTLQVGREPMAARLAFVVQDMADLQATLAAYGAGSPVSKLFQGNVEAQQSTLDLLMDGEEAKSFVAALVAQGKLEKLAQLWVTGVAIEWQALYSGDKPRRLALPTYPFKRKRYWIPKADKENKPDGSRPHRSAEADEQVHGSTHLINETEATLKQLLFLHERWQATPLPDAVDWTEAVTMQRGRRVWAVYAEETDGQTMRALLDNLTTLLPAVITYRVLGWQELFTALTEMVPDVILIVSGSNRDDTAHQAVRELYQLAQTLMHTAWEKAIDLFYLYEQNEHLPIPALQALSGLTRSIALENPQHRYQLIAVAPVDVAQRVRILLHEWLLYPTSGTAFPSEIRYTADAMRESKQLQEIDAIHAPTKPAFRHGVTYLISGGFGAIGQALCTHLATHYQCRLVILGRSELGEAQWTAVQQLEALGATVLYQPVDITDHPALRATMQHIKREVPRIDGVLHLARMVEDGLILQKEINNFMRVSAPKVVGTRNLDDVTRDEPLDFFITFSSMAAYGLRGASDYAYATAYQNAFAQWRARLVQQGQRSGLSRALCWGQWAMDPYSTTKRDNTLAALGFDFLTLAQGLATLAYAVAQPHAVVGAIAAANKAQLRALLLPDAQGAEPAEHNQQPLEKPPTAPETTAPEITAPSDCLLEQLLAALQEGRQTPASILTHLAEYNLAAMTDAQIEMIHSHLVPQAANGKGVTTSKREPRPVSTITTHKAGQNGKHSGEYSGEYSGEHNGKYNSKQKNEHHATRATILRTVQSILKISAEELNPQRPLQNYGLDSITGTQLSIALERALGIQVLPRWLIDYPTVDALAEKLDTIQS